MKKKKKDIYYTPIPHTKVWEQIVFLQGNNARQSDKNSHAEEGRSYKDPRLPLPCLIIN